MSAREPDWDIRIPGTEVLRLTERQRELLRALEDELPTSRADDSDRAMAAAASIVRALAASGLTAQQIADNSRLRPAAVKAMLETDGPGQSKPPAM
ncbi:hypothetical protein [Microbacterium oleivorans]|uniref:hypothetical protein n=1 Tax=Microbacterium oleivorans TaxID=273677 RepID=UPI0020412780|nr:hypothetical protein [Microbacterium oleivorans]MCM3695197.1 hypothetical protein [Microbacterium oleivorans]